MWTQRTDQVEYATSGIYQCITADMDDAGSWTRVSVLLSDLSMSLTNTHSQVTVVCQVISPAC